MLINLLNWIWAAMSAFLWGFECIRILGIKYRRTEADLSFAMGICLLTVFAEFFSLIHGVGGWASLLVLLIDLAILAIRRKDIVRYWKDMFGTRRVRYVLAVAAVCAFAFLLLASGPIYHYDTNLYHAQSIHWIEDYGMVPGLGNLHNRLAYNSSFFCLQALFSWRFLVGRSLHGMNGLLCAFFLTYVLCSFKAFRERRFFASDYLRLSVILLLNFGENLWVVSSPGSDFLALGLVLYILIKWVSYLEDGIKDTAPYAILCILGVFAVSVKLSSAMIVFLVIMPAVKLIRQKKWREILFYLVSGTVVILPFLIRNVILSGYLIYPFPELDLFSVDWKMSSFALLYDRNEIKTWGWGLNDVEAFATPFREWFPVWISKLDQVTAAVFYSNFILAPVGICRALQKAFREHKLDELLILCVMTGCFLFWFTSAPLPRYGIVFTVILPLYVLGDILAHGKKFQKYPLAPLILIVVLGTYLMYPLVDRVLHMQPEYPIKSADYDLVDNTAYELGNITIYVPTSGDQSGYYAFPSTPYRDVLSVIELRGTDLKDGFRVKDEYRNSFISTNGSRIFENNIFQQDRP